MIKKYRLLIIIFFILYQVNKANTSYVETKISGSFDFSSAHIFTKKKDSPNFIFFTKALFYSDIKYVLNDENLIGFYLNLKPTSRTSMTSGSYIYYISKIGKFEFGSPKEAGKKLQINSLDISKSKTWENFINLNDKKNSNVSFITGTKIQINKDSKLNEFSRKISYFTPKFNDKFQMGLSYIPDSENLGYAPHNMNNPTNYTFYMDDGSKAIIHTSLKNIFSYGISFEDYLDQNIDYKIAFNGKFGKPSKKAKIKKKNTKDKEVLLSNFNIYNIGGLISRGCWSYSASYGNLNKSLTSEIIKNDKKDSSWFGLGVSYNQGPVGAAINYYNSDNIGNKLSLISFSTDYRIRKGFKAYFETSFYNTKIDTINDSDIHNTVMVLGMKISF